MMMFLFFVWMMIVGFFFIPYIQEATSGGEFIGRSAIFLLVVLFGPEVLLYGVMIGLSLIYGGAH